jgi:hypothetical protein
MASTDACIRSRRHGNNLLRGGRRLSFGKSEDWGLPSLDQVNLSTERIGESNWTHSVQAVLARRLHICNVPTIKIDQTSRFQLFVHCELPQECKRKDPPDTRH